MSAEQAKSALKQAANIMEEEELKIFAKNLVKELNDAENAASPNSKKRTPETTWFRLMVQAVVAGVIVAGGALVVYPPLKDVIDAEGKLALRQSEIAQADARLVRLGAEIQKKENDIERKAIKAENEANKSELQKIRARSAAIEKERLSALEAARQTEKRLLTVQQEFSRLAGQLQSNTEKSRALEDAAEKARAEADLLRQRVNVLKKESEEDAARTKEIDQEINTRALKRVTFRIIHSDSREKDAKDILSTIKKSGGNGQLFPIGGDHDNHERKAYYTANIQKEALDFILPKLTEFQEFEPVKVPKDDLGDFIALWVADAK